jgi:hypothetical protein
MLTDLMRARRIHRDGGGWYLTGFETSSVLAACTSPGAVLLRRSTHQAIRFLCRWRCSLPDRTRASFDTRRLFGAGGLVAVLLLAVAITMPGAARSAPKRTCGFYRANLHTVSKRKNISCAEAKHVLLHLRGRRDTIPMICGKSRTIHGWRVESRSRLWSAVVNRYSRGRQSFVYAREQNAYRIYCPPKGGSASEGV